MPPTIHATLSRSAVAVEKLQSFAGNPQRGDVEFIKRSLEAHGQYRPIVVNKGTKTGRLNEVLAGNHTLQAARELGMPKVAVSWLDVDEAQARRIVVADNEASKRSSVDQEALTALLDSIAQDSTGEEVEAVLAAVGTTEDDLDRLLKSVHPEPSRETLPAKPRTKNGPRKGTGEAPGMNIAVGPHRFRVSRAEWDEFESVLRAQVGFEDDLIEAQLRQRLGFDRDPLVQA